MADTDIEQIAETDLNVKLNGICYSTEQLEQSIDSQKTNKIIDKNEQNSGFSLNSDKSCFKRRKSLFNCCYDGEDDNCEIIDENKHKIINTDCKSDNSIIENDHTLESENATMISNKMCDAENSYGTKEINSNDKKEQIEVNDTEEEQKTEDDKDKKGDKNEIIDQNYTKSRSNKIKKSLKDSRINLDKSVTTVKFPDPKKNSESSDKKKMKSLSNINLVLRRSTRNLNKLKSFTNKNKEKKNSVVADDNAKISPQKTPMITKLIVNDTKKSVKIATKTKQKKNKKKQTLVIDSNILIGRNNLPIPMYVQSNISSNAMNVIQSVSKSIQNSHDQVQQFQIIKPFILATTPTPITVPTIIPKRPIILPNLTDNIFVIEAPSFVVPYIYEKPHNKILKEFLEKNGKINVFKEDEDENQFKESLDKTNKNKLKEKSSKKLDTNKKMDVNESEKEVSDCEKKSDGSKENSFKNNKNGDEKNMIVDESKNTKKDYSKSKTLSESTDLKKIDVAKPKIQSPDYFDNILGKFFMEIGSNLVHEHVQLDLLSTQTKKRDHKGNKCPEDGHMAISYSIKTTELSKKNNDPFQFGLKKCELCNFKSESRLVMAHHLETPHMTANGYLRCNFCTFLVYSPREILQHMDTHNIRGRLDKGPALHQCPSCPFEIKHESKLIRHLFSCSKKYRPEINQAPPFDWEPPAKIIRKLDNKPSMIPANAVYQATMTRFKQFLNPNMLQLPQQYNKMVLASDVGPHHHCTILPAPQFPGIGASFPTTLPNQTSGH